MSIRGTPERLAHAIAGQVVNLVLNALDFDELLTRIDMNAVLARVDVNELLGQIDVNPLIEHIDVNALVADVDVGAMLQQIDLEAIIARSTTSVLGSVLDVVRRQGVGLDDFVAHQVDRLLGRTSHKLPTGPPSLVGSMVPATIEGGPV